MGRLEGRSAIVTGAAGDVGRACVEALAREGARVLATDVDEAAARTLAERLGADGLTVAAAVHDVSLEAHWIRVVDDAVARFGALDVLVNSAHIVLWKALEAHGLDDFRRIRSINYLGPFLGMKHAVPAMRRAGGGSIVNVSGVAGQRGVAGAAALGATEGGVKLMTKAVALECGAARDGIRVNSVHPGAIQAAQSERSGEDAALPATHVRSIDAVPLGRSGTPQDVAALVLFLASAESAYATGAEFTVDGGMVA